jgi:hypothetical protein
MAIITIVNPVRRREPSFSARVVADHWGTVWPGELGLHIVLLMTGILNLMHLAIPLMSCLPPAFKRHRKWSFVAG